MYSGSVSCCCMGLLQGVGIRSMLECYVDAVVSAGLDLSYTSTE